MVIDLGEQPTPEIEPADPPPGGVDAVEDQEYEPDPVVPDLSRIGNTAARDEMPEEVTEPTETDQGASSNGASRPEEESPA